MQITMQIETAAEAVLAAEMLAVMAEQLGDEAGAAKARARRSRSAAASAPAVAAPAVSPPPVVAPAPAAPVVAAPVVAAPVVARPSTDPAAMYAALAGTAPPTPVPATATPAAPATDMAALQAKARQAVTDAGIGPWFNDFMGRYPEDIRAISKLPAEALTALIAAAENAARSRDALA